MRNTVVCLTQSTLSSQSDPKTQLRALGELRVSQLGIGIGIGNISTMATFTSVGVGEWSFWKQPGQAVGAGRQPYRCAHLYRLGSRIRSAWAAIIAAPAQCAAVTLTRLTTLG